jgi:hypothetical protein
MKRFKIEQSDEEFYTSHSGISLVGLALNRFTSIPTGLEKVAPSNDSISHADAIKSYCGLLAQGKSDFVAIEQFRNDDFFRESLGNKHVPSEGTMRQRMDEHAEAFLPVLSWASIELLQKVKAPLTSIETGHVTVDIDSFAMDNSDSKKEKVSHTYRQFDGFLFLPAYIGIEGWMVNGHLLTGSQHPQKEFLPFLRETHARIRQFCNKKLLYRKDSAHDSLDNRIELSGYAKTDYIIKWNPRKENAHHWWQKGLETGVVSSPRPGKRVALFSVKVKETLTAENGVKKTFAFRRVMRVTERTIDKKGQLILIPEIELEGWWTSLKLDDEKVIQLYKGHGLCEQYHAEIKTDMDLERLPSGKFATNQLVMACGALVYNILRFVGQTCLVSSKGIIRHEAKRRRIKTVIQEMIYFAGRMISSGRRLRLRFSRHATAHAEAFAGIYARLAYG